MPKSKFGRGTYGTSPESDEESGTIFQPSKMNVTRIFDPEKQSFIRLRQRSKSRVPVKVPVFETSEEYKSLKKEKEKLMPKFKPSPNNDEGGRKKVQNVKSRNPEASPHIKNKSVSTSKAGSIRKPKLLGPYKGPLKRKSSTSGYDDNSVSSTSTDHDNSLGSTSKRRKLSTEINETPTRRSGNRTPNSRGRNDTPKIFQKKNEAATYNQKRRTPEVSGTPQYWKNAKTPDSAKFNRNFKGKRDSHEENARDNNISRKLNAFHATKTPEYMRVKEDESILIEKRDRRRKRNRIMNLKTSKGQPLMRGRIELMLEKIKTDLDI